MPRSPKQTINRFWDNKKSYEAISQIMDTLKLTQREFELDNVLDKNYEIAEYHNEVDYLLAELKEKANQLYEITEVMNSDDESDDEDFTESYED